MAAWLASALVVGTLVHGAVLFYERRYEMLAYIPPRYMAYDEV
jgi:capsid protein